MSDVASKSDVSAASQLACYGMTRGVDLWADPSKQHETEGEWWCPKAFNRRKIIISPGTGERKIKTGEFLGAMRTTTDRGCVEWEVGRWWSGGSNWDDGLEVEGGGPGRSSRTGNRGGWGNRGGSRERGSGSLGGTRVIQGGTREARELGGSWRVHWGTRRKHGN